MFVDSGLHGGNCGRFGMTGDQHGPFRLSGPGHCPDGAEDRDTTAARVRREPKTWWRCMGAGGLRRRDHLAFTCLGAGQRSPPQRTWTKPNYAQGAELKQGFTIAPVTFFLGLLLCRVLSRELVVPSRLRHCADSSSCNRPPSSGLAQRMGRVFASATTWHRLVRERGWRRPRVRVHPAKPKGIPR